MRFDPHLIHPHDDGPDDDGNVGRDGQEGHLGLPVGGLPPHLEALAEQLEADAARLAGKYPSGQRRPDPCLTNTCVTNTCVTGDNQPAASAKRRRDASWLARSAVAATVLAMGGWAALSWTRTGTGPSQTTTQAGREQGQPAAAAPLRVAQARDADGDPASRPQQDPAPQPAAPVGLPAVLFHDLTAPQQEAVLDLLEEHGLDQADLSI